MTDESRIHVHKEDASVTEKEVVIRPRALPESAPQHAEVPQDYYHTREQNKKRIKAEKSRKRMIQKSKRRNR